MCRAQRLRRSPLSLRDTGRGGVGAGTGATVRAQLKGEWGFWVVAGEEGAPGEEFNHIAAKKKHSLIYSS